MIVEKTVTEAIIIAVTEDSKFDWKLNIEANIPVFGADKNLRFMTWRINQGVPPTDGATVMATITPRQISSYWVKQGNYASNDIAGATDPFHCDWNFDSWVAVAGGATNGAVVVTPPKPRLAAPTTTSGVSDGETTAVKNWRINQENVNDRHAATLAFEGSKLRHNDGSIEPLYTLAETLAQFEEIAEALNVRFRARLAGGLVGAAQAAGATLTSVSPMMSEADHPAMVEPEAMPPADGIPPLIDLAALKAWAENEMGWKPAEIAETIKGAGYSGSADYMEKGGTVRGLAELLKAKLTVDDLPW